jgi:GNAT superfamily N-acetyltransferase
VLQSGFRSARPDGIRSTQEERMIEIVRVEPNDRALVDRFLRLPFDLYRDSPLWVPPILVDARIQLNPAKHPYYEHSEAEFYLARRGGQEVGRIALLENKPYNRYHDKKQAQFYLFECVDEEEVARALFEQVFERARARGLNQVVGPKGFGALDGYGMLVEGFEFRPAMTMMNYNPPYYPEFASRLGFRKEVDFVSCYLSADKFRLPERIHAISERAARRSGLQVRRFSNRKELLAMAGPIGQAYNRTFVNNWEYYPLSDREIKFLTDNMLTFADPKLIKVILHETDVIGFLFAFPDVSAAIQRSRGRLFPFGIADMLIESKRTKWVSLNGAGVLPEYHGRGGNALLYSEMEKTVRDSGFQHADLTQVAETAVQMRHDLENLGGVAYKNHRVFIREI